MGHVSRTHRVALDCLFDRIHLDPRIQIKFVDTKNQLADMWTKGKFHRDEWKHLFRIYWTSWTIACFLEAIAAKLTTLEPCRRGRCRKKNLEWRNVWLRNRNRVHLAAPKHHSKHRVRIQTVLVRVREVWMKTQRGSQEWHSEANTVTSTDKPDAKTTKKTIGTKLSHHNFEISGDNVILRQSIQMYDRNWIVPKETRMTSTSTRWSVESLCQQLWRRQYI